MRFETRDCWESEAADRFAITSMDYCRRSRAMLVDWKDLTAHKKTLSCAVVPPIYNSRDTSLLTPPFGRGSDFFATNPVQIRLITA